MRFESLAKIIIAIIPVLVAGCYSDNPKPGFSDLQTIISERLDKQIQWNQNSEDDSKVTAAVSKILTGELNCDQAVQIALLNNPELQASYEELGIAQADLVQAGLLKNPVFAAELHFVGGGIGIGSNLNIYQDFINLLQQPLRQKIGAYLYETKKLEIANSILKVASETKINFYSLQAAAELLNLRKTIDQGLKTSLELVNRQHAAGNISERDLTLERFSYGRSTLELSKAEFEVSEARERLNLLLGLSAKQTEWKISQRLPDLPKQEIDLSGLQALASANRLDLLVAKQEIEGLAQKQGLIETYKLIPDLNFGIDLEGESKSKIVPGPNFEFPLPIFDQGQANIDGTNFALRQAQKKYVALGLRIQSEVHASRNRMLVARKMTEFAKQTLLPLSQKVVQQTQLEYNSMLSSVFSLIAAKNEEIEAGNTYVNSLRDYWVEKSQLEEVVGGKFETLKKSL